MKQTPKNQTLEIVDYTYILWFIEESWYRTPVSGDMQRKGLSSLLEDWQMFT